MDADLIELILANVAFVGSHFAMSHPLRAPMVGVLGERGFQLAYVAVSVATLYWVSAAFKASPAGGLPGSGTPGWIVATVLTLLAMVLLTGSFVGNPALPAPGAEEAARSEPSGVFRVTRHPMMWAFALWALSHIVLWWSWRTTITAFAIGLLALVGASLQDRKKERLMGDAWELWESRTSYWPRWPALLSAGWLPWIIGLALFALFSWLHGPLGGVDAGVWRWL
ncbi:MAG: NnrU family protein [Erythrobacter sp.]